MWNRMSALFSNAEARARLLFWMWVLSVGVLLVGFAIIAMRIFAR